MDSATPLAEKPKPSAFDWAVGAVLFTIIDLTLYLMTTATPVPSTLGVQVVHGAGILGGLLGLALAACPYGVHPMSPFMSDEDRSFAVVRNPYVRFVVCLLLLSLLGFEGAWAIFLDASTHNSRREGRQPFIVAEWRDRDGCISPRMLSLGFLPQQIWCVYDSARSAAPAGTALTLTGKISPFGVDPNGLFLGSEWIWNGNQVNRYVVAPPRQDGEGSQQPHAPQP